MHQSNNSYKKNSLNQFEKKILEERITRSIIRLKRKRIFYWWSSGAAAIFLLLVAIKITTNYYPQKSGLAAYIKNHQAENEITDSKDIKLIMGGTDEINISSDEAKITYSEDGKNINVNANKKIQQKLLKDNMQFNTVIVPYGKRLQITLSEGTKVWLNSGSKITYPAVFSTKKREVHLEGEAIFDVAHNSLRSFYVKTKDFEIEVLGTVFNVAAYSDEKESSAVLEKGSIKLNYTVRKIFSKTVAIKPGTRAVFNPEKKEIKQYKVDTKLYTSWKNGILILQNESLDNILKKISRYYNIKFSVQNSRLKKETFSGSLNLRNSAQQVLDVIAETVKMSVEHSNKKIIIH